MTPSETAELRTFISAELQKVHSRLGGVEEGLGGLRGDQARMEEGLRGLRDDQARMEGLAASQFAQIEACLTKAETAREETHRDFGAFREDLQSINPRPDAHHPRSPTPPRTGHGGVCGPVGHREDPRGV